MVKLVRFDPFRELDNLQRRWFGDNWTNDMSATDVYTDNNGKELVVEAHLPNFNESDIDVSVDEGDLVISAEKHETEQEKGRKYVIRESASSFYRRIRLPERADSENIQAKYEDGTLKIFVPLASLPEPKKISVKSNKK